MRIAVFGSGAMGSLFGALLAEAGEQVTLVDVRRDHVAAINTNGLTIEKESSRRCVRIPATIEPDRIGKPDVWIVFVKAPHTADAARTIARIGPANTLVVTLQNGMGNAEALVESVGPDRVVAGTTSHGATFLVPGTIRHAGAGETIVGAWSRAGAAGAQTIGALFNRAGIATRITSDVRRNMWAKLLINVGINAITALTNIRNGQLLDLVQTRQLSREAVEEAAAVAKKLGIAIDGDPVEKVFAVAAATAANRSSMGQDVDNRRMTEIGAINGFVVRMAQRVGVPVPINRTLTALVETLQDHF